MKTYDNGCFYTVMVSRAEVEVFKWQWPCSGLPDSNVWFQFAKRNGELVDIGPYRISDQVDGDAAIALSHDAQVYGAKRLGVSFS